jgi:hypothetical protein
MENRRRKAERKVTGKQLQTEKERDPKKNWIIVCEEIAMKPSKSQDWYAEIKVQSWISDLLLFC